VFEAFLDSLVIFKTFRVFEEKCNADNGNRTDGEINVKTPSPCNVIGKDSSQEWTCDTRNLN
jgi:hypothetical protein